PSSEALRKGLARRDGTVGAGRSGRVRRYPMAEEGLVVGLWGLFIAVYMRPAPLEIGWVKTMLLLGAAVVVPLGLEQALRTSEGGPADRLIERAGNLQPAAVVFLAISALWPPGSFTALVALLWLVLTGFVALAGLA